MSRLYFSLLIPLLLLSMNLQASPEEDFKLGTQAFKSGDNEAAVKYFESAMNQGMNTVSLHYNLASSYYKVGRYEEAKNKIKNS